MKKEIRTVCYDESLQFEAYRFEGIVQPFPNHFHEYYVIGLLEGGQRALQCQNQDYLLEKGDLIFFTPGTNHGCAPVGDSVLEYRAINIPTERFLDYAEEITGVRAFTGFSQHVSRDSVLAELFLHLHHFLMGEDTIPCCGKHDTAGLPLEKGEAVYLLMEHLLVQHQASRNVSPLPCNPPEQIEQVCAYLEAHYAQRITLDELCAEQGLSKSTMIRSFTKYKGITPYRYLETVRIGKAKKLLEQGAAPLDAAMQTGFSDQSHFTNQFSSYIGVSPGSYRAIFQNNLPKEYSSHDFN